MWIALENNRELDIKPMRLYKDIPEQPHVSCYVQMLNKKTKNGSLNVVAILQSWSSESNKVSMYIVHASEKWLHSMKLGFIFGVS